MHVNLKAAIGISTILLFVEFLFILLPHTNIGLIISTALDIILLALATGLYFRVTKITPSGSHGLYFALINFVVGTLISVLGIVFVVLMATENQWIQNVYGFITHTTIDQTVSDYAGTIGSLSFFIVPPLIGIYLRLKSSRE